MEYSVGLPGDVGVPRGIMAMYGYGVHPGACIDKAFLKHFS